MAYKPVEIDDSAIPQPPAVDITAWEPPRHVYFGPKDARGRMAKEPPKSTALYPSTRYAKQGEGLKTIHVASAEDDSRLGPEWKHSPEDHGFITHPTRAQIAAMNAEPEVNKGGRPRKEAA